MPDRGAVRKQRFLRRTLSDLVFFVRSQEANKAIAAVTFEELMQQHINRNGDSPDGDRGQYNPYSWDPENPQPATSRPFTSGNYAGGADVYQWTKLDRVKALKNEVQAVIAEIRAIPESQLELFDLADVDGDPILYSDSVIQSIDPNSSGTGPVTE